MDTSTDLSAEAREIVEFARNLVVPKDLAGNVEDCVLVFTTQQHEYEVGIKSDATSSHY